MERLTKRILPTAVAAAAGALVIAGYLIPYGLLTFLRDQLIRWAAIVAAFAFILGLFNVLRVHLERVTEWKLTSLYSGVLILAALTSLGLTLGALLSRPADGGMATALVTMGDWWFQHVLSPLQASAAGLVAFVLALAAFRLLRSRRSAGAILFLFSAAVVLLGTLPLADPIGGWIVQVREWWMAVPAMAGMRGLLIGVGLGTLLMGLRVIAGLDRPHSDL